MFPPRLWALCNPCICFSCSLLPSLPACLHTFVSLCTLDFMSFDCMRLGVCLTALMIWVLSVLSQTGEGGHSTISYTKPKFLLSSSLFTFPRTVYTALSHHSPLPVLWVGDLGSACSCVSLTHQAYSQMSKPYLNDFIGYSFLFVVGSIPLFCAISFAFKRFGNYCNPRDRWKKQTEKKPINSCCIYKFIDPDSWK